MTGYPREVRTERLLLRQWRDDDVAPLAEIYDDPEVERQLVPITYDDTVEQVARFRAAIDAGEPSQWAVEELSTGRFVGRVGLKTAPEWPLEDSPYEVGWTFARDVWGRGYATEGGRASLAAGFAHLDLDHVISFTRRTNVASRRVMEKLGMTLRGEADYKAIPHVWYSITRDEWTGRTSDA